MNAPTEKQRWPRTEAFAVAAELSRALIPATSKLIVAGSLRRGKAMVGDVEIVYIPKDGEMTIDLFKATVNLADAAIEQLLRIGTLKQRLSKIGRPAWGEKNKLVLHRSGIPVDLFAASFVNWWNYLVCRTGPAESNTAICMAAQKKGWKWAPYSIGFARLSDDGKVIEEYGVTSEEEVFDFVGLPYLPPEERV